MPLAINNIAIYDSNITVNAIPFTITTSIPDTNSQDVHPYLYDGCHLDAIPELYAEQTMPLLIYPNPTDAQFTVEYKTNYPLKTEIEIYNINAERIYSSYTFDASVYVDLSGYSKGLYFVRMSNETWVKTGKVMVAK